MSNEVRFSVSWHIYRDRGPDDQKDRFETLCHVAADISTAPFKVKRGVLGIPCYSREFDVVLLVGLTELKAQIRWVDSETVRISDESSFDHSC